MLTIHVCQSTIGMLRRRTVQVPWTGASFRQILAKHRDPAWSDGAPISVISGCAMVDELDVCPPDGAHIVIAPTPGVFESAIANFFAAFLISTALNIAISYLTAPDLSEIDATDESSPTYGFSGIHTSYGTGFRVPVVFGRHAVGGQMVSIESTPLNPDTNAETLKMVLALSEGPIYSIGGVKQDLDLAVPESANSLFPQGILVNDVALQADEPSAGNLGGLRISTRLGNEWQTPMRGFEEPRSTIAVGAELEDAGDSHVVFISGTESTVARAEVSFPQGLYRQDPSGVAPVDPNGYDARFTVKVRGVPSSIPWSAIQGIEREVETGPVGRREALAIGVEMRLDTAAPSSGLQTGYEIRVERTSAAHADTAQEVYSEGMVFNRVVHGTDNAIAYVRRAVMGVHMRGTERFQGNRPNVLTPVEGQLVRVWDSVHGVSTKSYYDLPESGDTFHGIWSYQPGRNPGWAAVRYISADTMIRNYIAGPGGDIDIHIDWPAFRNLADYCDQSTAFAQPKWKAAEFVDPSTGSDVAKPDPSAGSLDCVLYPPGSSATAADAISGQLLALRTVGDEAQHSLQFDVSGALTGWHVRVDTDGLGTYAYGQLLSDIEAFHSCDINYDHGLDGWPGLMSILRTCRAMPRLVGRTISVVYQYRDAHGRGTNSVPAKQMVDVIGTSSVEDFSLTTFSVSAQPNVLVGQFLNEAKNYDQDEVPLEDPNAAFEAEALLQQQRKSSAVRMYGITSESRIARELDFMHKANYHADHKIAFTAGIEQIALEPGDVFGLQHDNVRPLSDGAAYVSARCSGAISGTSVSFTKRIRVPTADVAYNATYKATDGDVEQITLTPPAGKTTIEAGEAWTASATVTCPSGAVFAFGGTGSEDIQQYIAVAAELTDDMKVKLEAVPWTPEAYD